MHKPESCSRLATPSAIAFSRPIALLIGLVLACASPLAVGGDADGKGQAGGIKGYLVRLCSALVNEQPPKPPEIPASEQPFFDEFGDKRMPWETNIELNRDPKDPESSTGID